MAATLAKIVGVEQGVRASTEKWWKLVSGAIQREDLLIGHRKTYAPEEGNLPQPTDERRVQINVEQMLAEARQKLSRYFDITASKDWGNIGDGGARADLVLDGHVMLHDVPATYLLFLQARLAELADVISKIPTQSAAEDWEQSTEPGIYRTAQTTSHKTKMIEHYEVVGLTPEHPGHLVTKHEDVISGKWTTVKMTSAPTVAWQQGTLERIAQMREAVQSAIYDANKIEVEDRRVSGPIMGFIFDGANGAKS